MTELELLTPTKIIKSRRHSISLVIDISGNFIVRAPINCSLQEINKFIVKKADWIIEKRSQHLLNRKFAPLTFDKSETINILGKTYSIILTEATRVKVADNLIYVPKLKSKEKLISYLKRVAKVYIAELVTKIALKTDLQFKSISISSAKTNWGSCSFNNKLHFSYKLIMCQENIVYYIICHELTHTLIKNHSKNFYEHVKLLCPDYKQCEKWLKENREIISVI